jgi:hypothetical protein
MRVQLGLAPEPCPSGLGGREGLKTRPIGRLAENGNGLRIELRGLIARIERGMTIEVRFLPAPKAEGETEEQPWWNTFDLLVWAFRTLANTSKPAFSLLRLTLIIEPF